MNGDPRRVRVNSSEVAAEIIEDELVIINLSNGTYYAASGMTTAAWNALVQGYSPDEIASALEERASAERDVIRREVSAFVDQLLAESIVLEAPNTEAPSDPLHLEMKGETVRLVLEVYNDMSDLLALDTPIPRLKNRRSD